MFPPFENESVKLLEGNPRANNLHANTGAVRLYALVLTENFEPLVKFCTKAKTASSIRSGQAGTSSVLRNGSRKVQEVTIIIR